MTFTQVGLRYINLPSLCAYDTIVGSKYSGVKQNMTLEKSKGKVNTEKLVSWPKTAYFLLYLQSIRVAKSDRNLVATIQLANQSNTSS